ncbi:MAG: hypothetical protein ACO3A4_04790 [Silvanigrellaceae bacterium]
MQIREFKHMRCMVQKTATPSVRGAFGTLFVVLVSCGTPSSVNVPLGAKTTQQRAQTADSTKSVSLTLTAAQGGAVVGQAFSSAEVFSFVDDSLLSGRSPLGAMVATVSSGSLNPPTPLSAPPFAAGKSFLPLSSSADDFWLVESSSSATNVIRPVNRLSSPTLAVLPEHLKAALPGGVVPIGFGLNFLILKSAASVWIVSRSEKQLLATELGFPDPAVPIVSAGQVKGSSNSVWLAGGNSLWQLTSSGSEWQAKQTRVNYSGATGNLQKIAGLLSVSNGNLGFSGAVLAVFDSKIFLSSLSIPSAPATGSPVATPTAGTPQLPSPMTFAQARTFCDMCHASNSGNTGALARLSGTENIATWTNATNKASIVAAVRDSVMPIGKSMTSEERASFLLFANDPKP